MKLESSYTPIRAVERSLDLLASLNRRPISRVQDLVADTGLPAPTIIRLLETLMATGHVQHHGRRVGYTVTARVAELSAGHHGLPLFLEPARPILTELTQDLLWPAALATLDGTAMVVRLSTIPDSPLAHTHSTLQKRLDLLSRAHGRAYLAFCPQAERKHLLTRLRKAELTHLPPGALEARMAPILARIRHLGHAERAHDIDPETTTLAVPVRHGGKVAATLGLTFFRGAGAKHQALLDGLHSTAQRLEGALT